MLTKHSLYFTFNGISSEIYGIMNVSTSSGLYEEPLTYSRDILEQEVRGKDRPYFQGIKKQPLKFNVEFAFEDKWDDSKIRQITRWLTSPKYYCEMYFSENPEKRLWVLCVDDPEIVHNGLSQGYLRLSFRMSDSYIYSPTYQTQIYTTSLEDTAESGTTTTNIKMTAHGLSTGDYIVNLHRSNAIRQVTVVDVDNITVTEVIGQTSGDLIQKYSNRTIDIEITNYGDEDIYPSIEIVNIGETPCKIKNLTDEGKELIFSNLDSGETVGIDCENEIIVTDKPETYRYDNSNLIFPKLLYGVNQLQLTGNFTCFLKYKFKFLT